MFIFFVVFFVYMYLLVFFKIVQFGLGILICGKYEKFCLFYNFINIYVYLVFCVKIMKYLKGFFYKIFNENKFICEGKKIKIFCFIIIFEKKIFMKEFFFVGF